MKGDILVERNDIVEGSAAKKRDEVTADGKENKDDVDVQDQGSSTGGHYRKHNTKLLGSRLRARRHVYAPKVPPNNVRAVTMLSFH